jgi:hypothetical protein
MVLGHFGVGLGAKKFAPSLSLGLLFMAAQWVDLLWPVLLLFDVEHVDINRGNAHFPLEFTSYPITHSLLMGIVWGACFGLVYYAIKKDWRSAVVLGLCVPSHWLLDLIVHKPDLPLFPGDSPRVGLGLWNFPVGTAIVEGAIFIIGLVLYLRSTRATDRRGKWGLWLLVFLLIANQIAGALSPLPPSAHAIGWAAQYQWIFILLGFWVDRHRSPTVS